MKIKHMKYTAEILLNEQIKNIPRDDEMEEKGGDLFFVARCFVVE